MPRRGRRGHRAHRTHHAHHHHHRRHRTNFPRVHIRTSGGGGGGGFVYGGQPIQCRRSCCRWFLVILIMMIGFILTMVGHFAKPFWGPEDDWCGFCREDRLATEHRLRNCRTVGPCFISVGFVGFVICYTLYKKSKNDQTQNPSDVEGQQTATVGAEAAGFSSSETTGGVIVYPPPPPSAYPAAAGMPGFAYPQPPFQLAPTAPYPPNTGGDFAYPPASTPQFSFPTAVELDPPPPSYEAAVATDHKSDSGMA